MAQKASASWICKMLKGAPGHGTDHSKRIKCSQILAAIKSSGAREYILAFQSAPCWISYDSYAAFEMWEQLTWSPAKPRSTNQGSVKGWASHLYPPQHGGTKINTRANMAVYTLDGRQKTILPCGFKQHFRVDPSSRCCGSHPAKRRSCVYIP